MFNINEKLASNYPMKVFKVGETIPDECANRTYIPAAALRHLGLSVNYHPDIKGTIVVK